MPSCFTSTPQDTCEVLEDIAMAFASALALDESLETQTKEPCVYVISDARGKTATGVVEAAASQFEDGIISIKQLRNVKSLGTVEDFLDANLEDSEPVAVFHTIVDKNLRRDIRRELDMRGIPSIDLLGPAITVISTLTDAEPILQPGRRTQPKIETN